jgi:rhodanese-related sulfurtransferase
VPTYYRKDEKPVVQFDPRLEISPFALYRRLDEGKETLLVDVRGQGSSRTLDGAIGGGGEGWEPPPDLDVVLFDDDGTEAVQVASHLIERGFPRVRALFGGLDLYEFALDPQVVGERTFLIRADRNA